MATRALIGYLGEDRNFTCTYNHYDGYPENLGKALLDFYDSEERAKSKDTFLMVMLKLVILIKHTTNNQLK